jgi:hypothetical protein
MLSGQSGRHYLATGWKLVRPLAEWRRADLHGHSGELVDEAAFRALVLENAEHQREMQALGRCEMSARTHTPWGTSQRTTFYADGVERHSTASHGGFELSSKLARQAAAVASFQALPLPSVVARGQGSKLMMTSILIEAAACSGVRCDALMDIWWGFAGFPFRAWCRVLSPGRPLLRFCDGLNQRPFGSRPLSRRGAAGQAALVKAGTRASQGFRPA